MEFSIIARSVRASEAQHWSQCISQGKKWRGDCWWKGALKARIARTVAPKGGVGVAWGVSPLPCKAILKYEEKNGGLSCTFGRNLFLFHIF